MADGEKELYDITKDPYELNNIVRDQNLSPIRAFLHAQLVRLEACVGRTCQEVAPKFPLTRNQQRKVDKERREEERQKEKEHEEKRQKNPAADSGSLGRRGASGGPLPPQLSGSELLDDGEGVAAADCGALGDVGS